MFLEDEFAMWRIRARRISVSVLVAVTCFAACIAAMLGLASVAHAGQTPQAPVQFVALVRPNDVDSGSSLFPSKESGFYAEDNGISKLWARRKIDDFEARAPTAKAATMIAQKSSTVNLPQTATRADEQIIRGLTMLLLALTAASGLAVWRRRIKRMIGVGAKRNGL